MFHLILGFSPSLSFSLRSNTVNVIPQTTLFLSILTILLMPTLTLYLSLCMTMRSIRPRSLLLLSREHLLELAARVINGRTHM